MKKILSVLLAVLMVATLIPAMFVAAEDDGAGEAPESAALDWLIYGVDDCFGVYDVAGTEKGKYKTLLDADLAMRNGYILKLLGNVRGMTETYTFFENRGANYASYTIDGQGFVFDVQLSTAKQFQWAFNSKVTPNNAFAWVFTPETSDNYVIVNLTLVSNAGCIRFSNKSNNVKSTYVLNNVQLYASDTYFDANPAYYCVENGYAENWMKPSVPFRAGDSVPANGYTAHTAVEVHQGSTNVTFNGANTKVIGRACALNGLNGRITINDGYFYANESGAYWNGDANTPAGNTTSSDGATIMLNWSNGVININGGEIVNEGEWHVMQASGSVKAVQCEAIRASDWQGININGGKLRAPGSIVHVRGAKTGNGVVVNVKGGVLISDEFGVEWAADGGEKKKESTESIIWIAHAAGDYPKGVTVNIEGGMFVNKDEMDTCMLFNNGDSNATWNLNGGVFLSTTNPKSVINKIYSASTENVKINKDNKVNWEGEDYYFLGMLPLANENAPTMEIGAAIRLKKNTKAALRFEAVLTTLQLDMLEAEADDALKFGAVIVPTDKLYQHGCYTVEALTAAVGVGGFATIDELTEDDLWETGDGYGYYIEYEVEDEDINTSFTAVPYVTDGVTTWYGSFDLVNSSRSVAEVAARALADVTAQKGRLYADASVLATLADFDYSDVTFDTASVWCYYQAESQQRMLGYLDDEYKAIAVGYVEETLAG